jgi:protein-S-isoprenylcysteine O-methyltransferase Ste14
MNKRDIKFILAPMGVAIGISVFVSLSVFVTSKLQIPSPSELLPFRPRPLIVAVGIIYIAAWLPIFISGIVALNRRGAVGQSAMLRTTGIYQYVRNPMYSGISNTILGLGLVLDQPGFILAGILWFWLTVFQCLREERELTQRFGEEYIRYRNSVPRFMPRFDSMVADLLGGRP